MNSGICTCPDPCEVHRAEIEEFFSTEAPMTSEDKCSVCGAKRSSQHKHFWMCGYQAYTDGALMKPCPHAHYKFIEQKERIVELEGSRDEWKRIALERYERFVALEGALRDAAKRAKEEMCDHCGFREMAEELLPKEGE